MIRSPAEVDELTALLRREDLRLRRATMLTTALCIVIGVLVVLWTVFTVAGLRRTVADYRRDIGDLEDRKAVLVKQIEERQRLVDKVADKLPANLRNQLETQEKSQQDESSHIDQGLAAARRGRYTEAIQAYSRALEINPDNKQVNNWRGYSLFRRQDYAEAAASFRQAIRIDDRYAEAHYNLALALWKLDQREPAVQEFRRAIQLDPDLGLRSRSDSHAAEIRRLVPEADK